MPTDKHRAVSGTWGAQKDTWASGLAVTGFEVGSGQIPFGWHSCFSFIAVILLSDRQKKQSLFQTSQDPVSSACCLLHLPNPKPDFRQEYRQLAHSVAVVILDVLLQFVPRHQIWRDLLWHISQLSQLPAVA